MSPTGGVGDLVAAPGARLLYARTGKWDGQVEVIDLDTFTVSASIDIPGVSVTMGLAVSPDGKHLYVGHREGVAEIDAVSRTVTRTLSNPAGFAPSRLVVSPDGRFLYGFSGRAGRFDLAGGEWTLSENLPPTRALAVSPDGKRLYLCDGKWTIRLLDAATLAVTATINDGVRRHTAAVHPDGRLFIAGASSEVRDGSSLEHIKGRFSVPPAYDDNMVRIALSPDGARICTASAEFRVSPSDASAGEVRGGELPNDEVAVAIIVAAPIGASRG
ncbi:YncE family protein [Streptomyces sp. PmtG]